MPQNRTIEGWLESITNPRDESPKKELKKRIYKSLKRKSTGFTPEMRQQFDAMRMPQGLYEKKYHI